MNDEISSQLCWKSAVHDAHRLHRIVTERYWQNIIGASCSTFRIPRTSVDPGSSRVSWRFFSREIWIVGKGWMHHSWDLNASDTKKHLFIYFFHLISGLEQCGGSFQNGFYEWVEEARIQTREYRGRNYSGDRFFAGRHGTTMRLFTNVLWNSEMSEILGDLRLANKF